MAREIGTGRKTPPGMVGGTYFKAWRIYRDLTQQQVADKIADLIERRKIPEIGCSKTRITEKEKGNEPWDNHYLRALSLALNVSELALQFVDPFEGNEPPTPVVLESLNPKTRATVDDIIRTYAAREGRKNQGG